MTPLVVSGFLGLTAHAAITGYIAYMVALVCASPWQRVSIATGAVLYWLCGFFLARTFMIGLGEWAM